MPGEIVTAVTSLGGVALGGGLSYLVQTNTQRMTARTEQRKQDAARAESRRAERLTHLERFIALAADAERIAFERPDDWVPGDAWSDATQAVMNRLWVAESMVQVLFQADVHAAARTYYFRINRAVWDGVPDVEALYPELDGLRDAFLAAAREGLG
ncbi:hypothetical protein ACPCHT_01095 [Nucisporomicrobium flavum]|uniref:hypothetical protein n=1 Tax=Nucisporomicrobium flavum TaxID=2785915 RepID=UPI0018F70F4F|nr:hypothetical protein [Nucisporomicrobium flavum]